MKSGTPTDVERWRRWIARLTTAESLLVSAVPAALIWAITAEQQVREMTLTPNPFMVGWSNYDVGDRTALVVAEGLWAALILVFWVRRRLMGKLAVLATERRVTASLSAERRGRLVFLLASAFPVLWFVSVVCPPVSAVWQIVSLVVGAWLAWEWRGVEEDETYPTEALCNSAAEKAEMAQQREMFGH